MAHSEEKDTCLYHVEIGFPQGQRLPKGPYLFTKYTPHALQAVDDRYGKIALPRPCIINFDNVYIFEIGTTGEELIKVVCRLPYNDTYDITYVLRMDSQTVITVWLNDKNDTHTTLDRRKYCDPNQ